MFKDSKKINFELFGITVDKGIKSIDSSIRQIKEFSDSLGVRLYTIGIKQEFGKGIDEIAKVDETLSCTYCGELRRILMDKVGKELGATKLGIGWTLDDNCIILTQNLYKNTSLRLVQFASPIFPTDELAEEYNFSYPRQIAPLRLTSEKEITLYAYLKEMDLYSSSSCPYPLPSTRCSPGWWRFLLNRFMLGLSSEFIDVREDIMKNFENKHLEVYLNHLIKNSQDLEFICPFCKEKKLVKTEGKLRLCYLSDDCMDRVGLEVKEDIITLTLLN